MSASLKLPTYILAESNQPLSRKSSEKFDELHFLFSSPVDYWLTCASEHLALPLAPLVHAAPYAIPAVVVVLIPQPLENPLRGMLLLGRP
jgi:hypothetical protein